jgi:hypothetical protein
MTSSNAKLLRKEIKIHQPKLLKNLKKEFLKLLPNQKKSTPALPKTIIIRPKEGDPTIRHFDQKKFRTGVGMLLYLFTHSRHDISNAVRELSRLLTVQHKHIGIVC